MMWPGVEPTRDNYNQTYLDTIKALVDRLGKRGIYVILDFHQDVMSRKFCGEGFPDFAAIPSNRSIKFPFPLVSKIGTDPETGYPLIKDCIKIPFFEFYFTTDACTAFQNFWDNSNGIFTSFMSFWQKVASTFKDTKNVIGYELINEPWVGNIYKDPSLLIPGRADKVVLEPHYKQLHTAIRLIDDQHIIFYEPVTWDLIPCGFEQGPGGKNYNDRQVFSYHIYCFDVDKEGNPKSRRICDTFDAQQFGIRAKDSKRLGGGAFLTEFGALDNLTAAIKEVAAITGEADHYFHSWTYWQFKYFQDLTTANQASEGFYSKTGELQESKVKALSRTYAPIIAGSPIQITFDPETSNFLLRYKITNGTTILQTEIYLNEKYYYPSGYTVAALPPTQVSWKKVDVNRIVVIHTNVNVGDDITVSIKAKK